MTFEASLVDEIRTHTPGAIKTIVLSFPEEDGSGGDNSPVNFVSSIARREIISSRWMAKMKKSAMDAVMSGDVTARIAEEVS